MPREQVLQEARVPLIERNPEDIVAIRGGEIIRGADFIGHVAALAHRLPGQSYALNLCVDRYRFLVAFCAAIARGQCNLLLPNRKPATQAAMAERYQESYVLHDGCEIAHGLATHMVDDLSTVSQPQLQSIPLAQLCAVAFTSGSTGEPKANCKYWHTLLRGSELNLKHLLHGLSGPPSLLATVPPQHMYGLELSVLWPMRYAVTVHGAQPLYPADVASALAAMPPPRVLVSTPVHLRALVASGLSYAPVARVLSATAPLEGDLAMAVETLFQGELLEVYGCSEVGCMATRRPVREDLWRAYPELTLRARGNRIDVHATHLPEPVPLQDEFESVDGGFRLRGRAEDMVNIAGKRGSLAEFNRYLRNIPGLRDGVIFQPDSEVEVSRLAALVVAPQLSTVQIAKALRCRVDAVFLPRPIVHVDALPRSETGKLARAQILQLYRDARGRD